MYDLCIGNADRMGLEIIQIWTAVTWNSYPCALCGLHVSKDQETKSSKMRLITDPVIEHICSNGLYRRECPI